MRMDEQLGLGQQYVSHGIRMWIKYVDEFMAFSEALVLTSVEDRIINILDNCSFHRTEPKLLFYAWKTTISLHAWRHHTKAGNVHSEHPSTAISLSSPNWDNFFPPSFKVGGDKSIMVMFLITPLLGWGHAEGKDEDGNNIWLNILLTLQVNFPRLHQRKQLRIGWAWLEKLRPLTCYWAVTKCQVLWQALHRHHPTESTQSHTAVFWQVSYWWQN